MAKIAYVDHSFHKITQSTAFLPDLLRKHGHEVVPFWDEAWQGGAAIEWEQVRGHDVVLMFQSFCPPRGTIFSLDHPNVTYIPMLDQFGQWRGATGSLSEFWRPFEGAKVLNFSNALHSLTLGFGIASFFARYFPPHEDQVAIPTEGLHGFFWLRRESELPWATVARLIGNTRFDSFHLHFVTDPTTPNATLPTAREISQHNITMSQWFERKSELDAVVSRANIYFAPRLAEGIGQSFLEAMSRGQCVVAPNQGTMNEYILPGTNGLLYDEKTPKPLDFSKAVELGRCAGQSVAAGRAKWVDLEQAIVKFLTTPSRSYYERIGNSRQQSSTWHVASRVMTKFRTLVQNRT
ncbi:glycosyl transferases group 1 [Variibacter gotjawalensis]|uniref:Glycosyl transferases group 1 n=1 Tax=Variibacter gotjawalensis TaxID=1333996 RepID=A0A0S3PNU7_9BRAD|nr:glycosyltransferase [Variibacter gotjawalensis]NIK47897.1 hypothetical protein [Variibacter gotjawalensis]RZS49776.1 glycosyl transferase family 1 [Variibacter gotjawalensis]BAT57604.1 glycosyl transferases group 1 [Variibacter gotjawalensis]